MTITLTNDKAHKLQFACLELLHKMLPTNREVARVIGKLVASFPGVMHGPLYYRTLERCQIVALKASKAFLALQNLIYSGG